MPVMSEKVLSEHLSSGAPLMKTYSALGILKNSVEPPYPRIAFVTPETYGRIRHRPWNRYAQNPNLTFYTLLPEDENPSSNGHPGDVPPNDQEQNSTISDEVVAWLRNTSRDDPMKPYVYMPTQKNLTSDNFVRGNDRLGRLRRYILIIVSGNPAPDAYVSHFYHGQWYSIAGNDEISQKNFDLISLFMTMMAVPSTTPPLTPTISTGGGM